MTVRHLSFFGCHLLGVLVIALLFTFFAQPQQATGTAFYPANIDYEGISNYGNYNPVALTNPNIGAVDISMNWSQVEPEQGVFNWAPADKVMADWSNAGKKFTMVVRFANEGGNCNNNRLTPTWELAKIPSFCDADYGNIVPDYFNPTFKADWKAYVQAIGQHIASSPYKNNLLYIRIAVGLGGEGFPLSGKGDYLTVDKPQLVNWGYTPTAWAAWQEEMLTSYKTSIPFATIIYPLNGLDTDPATGKPIQVEVAQWAAPQGFGLGQQGLQPGTNSPIFQQLRSQYPHIYIQYQTIYLLNQNVTPTCDSSCVAQADVQAAETNGAQFIEWYSQDITNSSLQSFFAQWQQYVNGKFGGGNSTPTPMNSTPSLTSPPSLTATPNPSNPPAVFFLIVCLHGLGNCGDNANPSSTGNTAPLHTQRTVTLSFSDATNSPVATINGIVTYNPSIQNFQGTITANTLASGQYIVVVKADGYLAKQIPGVVTVTHGQQVSLPKVFLTAGDIDNDNQLDILDYNILISCFNSRFTTSSCPAPATSQSPGADLDDDGTVDGADYNLFLRELSVQHGG